MLLLAIDTAGVDCAVGLYDQDAARLVGCQSNAIGKGHAECLMAMIDTVLAQARADISDVGRVAVTIGPGSFTGIRVGVAAARGFGLALACPVIGVTTLEVLAADAVKTRPGHALMTAMDGRRSDVYVQVFGVGGEALTEAMVLSPEEAGALARLHHADIAGSGRAIILGEGEKQADHFPMQQICAIAAARPDDGCKPKPLYLRGADAKPQTGFALERA